MPQFPQSSSISPGQSLCVRVIPGAKVNRVMASENGLRVYVTAKPVDNAANGSVLKVLAKHLGVRANRLTIIKGLKSRDKTIKMML